MGKVIAFNNKQEKIRVDMTKEDKIKILKYILYYLNTSRKNTYITKINKLLFYTQFLYFKKYNIRLLNVEFVKDRYGPVIQDLNLLIKEYNDKELLNMVENLYGTYLVPLVKLNPLAYDECELNILREISNKFDTFTALEISNYSHEESLWLNTGDKEIINLDRACELNDFE